MSDIRFTVKVTGASNVARLLRRHPEMVGRTLLSLVKQEARGLGVELARNTRHFGFGQKARKTGEKAVAGDVRKVYATPAQAYESAKAADMTQADRFWAHVTNGRFARARDALAASQSRYAGVPVGRLDPALHKARRNHKGAVAGNKPSQVVTSKKALDLYIARKQKRVGFAKGVWIQAAKAVGGRVRGAAQWVTRHKQAPGTAIVRDGDKARVTLVSTLDYMDEVTTDRGIQLALEVAQGRLRRALAESLRKVAQRTNRGLGRAA